MSALIEIGYGQAVRSADVVGIEISMHQNSSMNRLEATILLNGGHKMRIDGFGYTPKDAFFPTKEEKTALLMKVMGILAASYEFDRLTKP